MGSPLHARTLVRSANAVPAINQGTCTLNGSAGSCRLKLSFGPAGTFPIDVRETTFRCNLKIAQGNLQNATISFDRAPKVQFGLVKLGVNRIDVTVNPQNNLITTKVKAGLVTKKFEGPIDSARFSNLMGIGGGGGQANLVANLVRQLSGVAKNIRGDISRGQLKINGQPTNLPATSFSFRGNGQWELTTPVAPPIVEALR